MRLTKRALIQQNYIESLDQKIPNLGFCNPYPIWLTLVKCKTIQSITKLNLCVNYLEMESVQSVGTN